MQSVSLRLSKRLSNSSKPLWTISPSLVAHGSTTSSTPPPSPPISAASLNNLLTAPWSASQTRGITLPRSDVRTGNLIEHRGRAYEVLKLYHEGAGKAAIKVPPHTAVGYATTGTTTVEVDLKGPTTVEVDIKGAKVDIKGPTTAKVDIKGAKVDIKIEREGRNSGLNQGPKTKREQLLKVTAAVPLLLIYPNAYSLLLANFFVFWHINAGIEEILADYVHHEMTREFVMISLRLFLIKVSKIPIIHHSTESFI